MLKISELQLGYSDAENYKRKENKVLFSQLFVKDESVDKICEPSTSFLIGEKGTGKTAYAVYFMNSAYRNHNASLRYIRETEYRKFIALKKERHLDLSDYANIWKVILYLLLSQQIKDSEGNKSFLSRFVKFKQLKQAIDEYYLHAFSPEIIYALQFVEKSKIAAELLAKYAKVQGSLHEEISFSESRFQTNLLYIQRQFEKALRSLKLSHNHLLFIDGIDIRPSSVPYSEYLECIKGLANAVWSINNDFFAAIKDSPGRMRAILLIRPDIFQSLGLQNQNTKIRDNSVILDWRTTYKNHRTSHLFKISDRLLSIKQDVKLPIGDIWDYYFPFNATNLFERFNKPSSFITFLRLSLWRPRDIISMLCILKENVIELGLKNKEIFKLSDLTNPAFKNKLAEYLLGEVKDHLLFYYSRDNYETFLKFFEYLEGKLRFTYEEYLTAFKGLSDHIESRKIEHPSFMNTPNDFLQFLYGLNVICYIEETEDGEEFLRWCFRERSYSNIAPKVKAHEKYLIHYGLGRALNIGKKLRRRRI